jgi:predicted MPP superfamily phosphohydrolase
MYNMNQVTKELVPRTVATNLFIGFTFALLVSKLILASIFLLIDFSRLITWIIDKVVKLFSSNAGEINLEGRRSFLIKLGLGIAAIPFASFLYGITKGKYNYKVRKISLTFDNLDPAFDGYKIVQISDIHAGSFDSPEQVQKGIEMMNAEQPDLVLFTGDLVNDRAEEIDAYVHVFKSIEAKDGIYSITGNHDYGDYFQWENVKQKEENFKKLVGKHADLGFKILMNQNVKIQKGSAHFNLLGIENWGLPPFPQHGDLNKALSGVDNQFTLLMSHDPSHWDAETVNHANKVDLTLSGHTHGMQFGIEIPGIKWSPVKYKYPRWAGLYEQKDRKLYVNRGFGFLGLPGRVGIWPEITVIELKSSKTT